MLTARCTSSISDDPFDKEQIQAWLLITIYERMRSLHRQAWITLGRAFRLVQLLRLHELDNPSLVHSVDADFIEREEERRAFWLAYLLATCSESTMTGQSQLVVSLELCFYP